MYPNTGYATDTSDIAVDLHHSPGGQGGKSPTEVFSEDHISQWVKQATPRGPKEPFNQLQDALLMLKPTMTQRLRKFFLSRQGDLRNYGFHRPSLSLPKERGQRQHSQLMSNSERAVNNLFWKTGEEQQQQPTTFFLLGHQVSLRQHLYTSAILPTAAFSYKYP